MSTGGTNAELKNSGLFKKIFFRDDTLTFANFPKEINKMTKNNYKRFNALLNCS